ncbi:MAG: TSUP family transporter, partial [Paracoccaceae bacterium]
MPDAIASALQTPELIWLIMAISAAGLVRGFTGFGTALIFVPVAGQYLPPADVILLMACTGMVSNMAILPKAWGTADRREVGALVLAAVVTIPFGIWVMSYLDTLTIRWIVAVVAGTTLVAVI